MITVGELDIMKGNFKPFILCVNGKFDEDNSTYKV